MEVVSLPWAYNDALAVLAELTGGGAPENCELTKASGEEGSDAVAGEKMIARDRYHQPGTDCDGADPVAPTDSEPADAGAADHAAAQSERPAPPERVGSRPRRLARSWTRASSSPTVVLPPSSVEGCR